MPSVRSAAMAALLALTGCSMPNFEGPQIQEPPLGFREQPNTFQQQRLFPDLELVHHDTWVNATIGEFSIFYIDGHPGAMTRGGVEHARSMARATATEPITFGEVEELTIDGRRAWGWSESLGTPERGLESVTYRVAIPYDTITYVLELYSADPLFKGQPDSLRVIASTFAVGRTRWNLPLVAIGIGAALFLLSMYKGRAQDRAARMRNIKLATIPKKEGKEGEEAVAAPRGVPLA